MWSRFRRAAAKKSRSSNVRLTMETLESRDVPAAFTPGDLVIYRVGAGGTGSTALTSAATAVFLDEYSPSGTLVQSVALPTSDNGANQTLTDSGSSTSAGLITLSVDGHYLLITGYDAAVGTAGVAGTASSTVNRVVGRVAADGTVDTTTALTDSFSTNNIRSAASVDGTTLYIGGAGAGTGSSATGGVRIATFGDTSSTLLSETVTNIRQVNIFDGQLYVSDQSGSSIRLGTVGSGLPTTSGQTITNLPGFATSTGSPYAFFFADLDAGVTGVDTLYVADDSATASGGGIQKYSLVSGTWTANGVLASSSGTATATVRGLTGVVSGTSVTLYTTNGSLLGTVTDTSGYNATITGTVSTLATAGTNTAFRGVAFVPTAANTPSVTNATTTENKQTTSGLVITANTTTGDATANYQITNITNGTLYKSDGTTVIADGDFITKAEGAAGLKFTPDTNFSGAASFDIQASTNATASGLGGSVVTATITVNGTGVIGDRVFIDTDANGVFNTGDTGVDGVTINLYADTNNNGTYDAGTDLLADSTITANGGQYLFSAVGSGTYFIEADAAGVADLTGFSLSGDAQPRTVVIQPVLSGVASQYDFNTGDLSASFGPGDLSYFNTSTETNTQFGSTTSFGIDGINGVEANVLKVPGTANAQEGYKLLHGAPANGGGDFLNQYTLVVDIYVPDVDNWTPFFNTDRTNSDDGDAFIRPSSSGGGIGINGDYEGTVNANTWYRIAITIDSSTNGNAFRRFIDGSEVGTAITLSSGDPLDGRFSAYLDADGGIILFADNDTDVNTFYVSSAFFVDRVLTDTEISDLGAADARGIVFQNDYTQDFAFTTATGTAGTPSVTDATTDEDTQTTSGLVITANTANGDATANYKITNITNGTLYKSNGTTVIANDTFITKAEGAAGLKFTPDANFNGDGSFDVQASTTADDTGLGGSVVTATITVNAVNDAPVAADGSDTTDEDTTLSGTVTATDVENDPLTYTLVDDVTSGSLTFNSDGTFTYIPNADFNGTDSFTFTANDGTVDSEIATFTITVNAVNDAPVAADGSASTDEDTTLNGSVSATDVDGDDLTYTLVDDVTSGSLTFNSDGTFTYIPAADFNGTDSFTFSANDGTVDSNTATFTITVNAVNDAPVAADGSDTTDEDTTLSGTVTATDVENDPLTYTLVDDVTSGSLTFNSDGTFTYTPAADFNGTDSFTFTANDGMVDSNTATFTITVNAINDAPVAADGSASTDEDTTLNGSVSATDVDGDDLTYTLVDDVSNGSLIFNSDGTFTYTPNADFNGTDSFTFTANDGTVDSEIATFTITVNAVNDAPVAADGSASTDEDTTLNGSVSATDVDNDPLTYALVSDVTSGTLTFNSDGTFTYVPNANFNGTDSFTFTANDGTVDSNTATFTITVNAVNDAPGRGRRFGFDGRRYYPRRLGQRDRCRRRRPDLHVDR